MGWFQTRFSSIKERSPVGLFVIKKHTHKPDEIPYGTSHVEKYLADHHYWIHNGKGLRVLVKKLEKSLSELDSKKIKHNEKNVEHFINNYWHHIHSSKGLVKTLKDSVDALTKRVDALEKAKA